MALNVSGLTNFTFQDTELLTGVILETATLQNVAIQTGVQYISALNILDISPSLKCSTACADFSASGSITFTQRTIAVQQMIAEDSLCGDTLKTYWTNMHTTAGSTDVTVDFQDFIVDTYLGKVAETVETALWQGYSNGSCSLTGFLTQLSSSYHASEGITFPATATGSLTVSNVYDVINLMVSARPAKIANKPSVLYMGYDAGTLYRQNLITKNFFINYGQNQGELFVPGFANIKVVEVGGLNGTDALVLSTENNLVVGTDLVQDYNTMDIWMDKYHGDQILMRAKMKFGTQFKFPGEIVINDQVYSQ